MASQALFVPIMATTEVPSLGDGYDPVIEFSDTALQTALSFSVEEQNTGGGFESKVDEIKDASTTETSFALTESFKEDAEQEFSFSSYSKIFEENSLFVLNIFMAKTSKLIVEPQLKQGMWDLAEDNPIQFRQKYGTRYVESVDFGGRVTFVYKFATRDTILRARIKESIQEAESSESRTLEQSLMAHHVSTSWNAFFRIAPLTDAPVVGLTPNLEDIRSILIPWASGVGSARPVRIRVRRYDDAFEGFPDVTGSIGSIEW